MEQTLRINVIVRLEDLRIDGIEAGGHVMPIEQPVAQPMPRQSTLNAVRAAARAFRPL